ncbi:hypothetical protein [Saccharopolyspora shandongensis]|uniref:Uncharacterized protein n=1 Tax=Saccharopolyspora shandongensis TaxID=418495 RepID=A0A1H3TM95_9PSEU|nr:hypothetical protein [Saccharopolyspora shandongensis]SDZ51346.1 hypothetical protein SAMN05216215_108724 [Saccharopolyspora shandongensis]
MREYRRHLGRRVLLHLDGATLDGVLVRADRDTVALREARMLSALEPSDMDGELIVERVALVWMQVV